MGFGLVLGAGGLVGMAYHVGALRALEEAGLPPAEADVVVGTSAGSVVGAYQRTGSSVGQLWSATLAPPSDGPGGSGGWAGTGVDPSLRKGLGGVSSVLAPAFSSPLDLVRRSVGSASLVARAAMRRPIPPVPGLISRAFPAGLYRLGEGEARLREELPDAWPDRPLWLCSMDVTTGRRVVLGRPGGPATSLPQGVLASCAIPGLYSPVRVGKSVLVDGGALSCSNLDLAVQAGCRLVIAIAPLAYDPDWPPGATQRLVRAIPARSLARESAAARRAGVEVLIIRPSRPEVGAHGLNMLRRDGLDRVARDAYRAAATTLRSGSSERALKSLIGA
ncbi:MAG: patatin-like phospholipase family protein [Acidimicrobiales bacterium]